MMNKLNKIDDYSIECLVALAGHFIASYWLFNVFDSKFECRKSAKMKTIEPVDPMEV